MVPMAAKKLKEALLVAGTSPYWPPRAVLFIDSFEYNDLTEFEGAEDFLVRWPIAGKNHADR